MENLNVKIYKIGTAHVLFVTFACITVTQQ